MRLLGFPVPLSTSLTFCYTDLGWLTGDLIAGITVGMVVVPQGMSYAQIATLPAQYGLYSSFVGVFIYCVSNVLKFLRASI